jgi:hypothetical protein
MAYFTAIEEVLEYMKPLLDNAASLSELQHVGFADDEMVFDYPAVVLVGEPTATELHGTHSFKNYFRVGIFVYHALVTETRDARTITDLELCTKIKAVLASDRTLGGGVVFGWVDSILPGTIRRPGNVFAIGSRLSWRGEALEAFQ